MLTALAVRISHAPRWSRIAWRAGVWDQMPRKGLEETLRLRLITLKPRLDLRNGDAQMRLLPLETMADRCLSRVQLIGRAR